MNAFLEKHAKSIIGVLSGWDRIVFRGTSAFGRQSGGDVLLPGAPEILLKDFKEYAQRKTAALIQASVAKAEQSRSAESVSAFGPHRQRTIALEIAARDGITEG